MRLRLLETWEKALVSGYFSAGVALSRNDRVAAIEQLSVLACIGLRQDLLQVELKDFEALWEARGEDALPIVREARRRLCRTGHDSLDVRLAATWGTQLQLVEAQGNAVRFPHSILQAYLGSRLIAYAMADADFCADAMKNAGRELLIALTLHSRATAKQDRRSGRVNAAGDGGDSPAEPLDLRTLLREKAHLRSDSKALDLYATALEIDSVDSAPEHEAIAEEIARDWHGPVEQDPRILEHAKLNLTGRNSPKHSAAGSNGYSRLVRFVPAQHRGRRYRRGACGGSGESWVNRCHAQSSTATTFAEQGVAIAACKRHRYNPRTNRVGRPVSPVGGGSRAVRARALRAWRSHRTQRTDPGGNPSAACPRPPSERLGPGTRAASSARGGRERGFRTSAAADRVPRRSSDSFSMSFDWPTQHCRAAGERSSHILCY